MRPVLSILTALCLAGCAGGQPRQAAAPLGLTLTDPEEMPVVLFRLMVIRDWASPYYIIVNEDWDLTLPAAVRLGIPPELWIRFLIEGPVGFRHDIYWVRPLRA